MTSAESPSFDLITEPWLPVRMRDGRTREVGLHDAFALAHDIAGFDVEFPTQEPALLRLLLAICYRALEGPENRDEWEGLWASPTLPVERFSRYFARWRERFDLFHPAAPFFGSPHLEPAGKDGIRPASWLVAHAPADNSIPVFTPITRAMALTLHPSEAARWLVERHAWGTTADRTGAKDNPQVKNGRDTPRIGHLGWIGFVAPLGRTLKETLLLNLVPWCTTTLVTSGPDDLPAWERPPTGPTREMRPPDGTCDLFTWQGRRIRLYPEDRDGELVVARVLICAGDDVLQEAIRNADPHTGWRLRKQPGGTIQYMPIKVHVGQQVWRGLASLLALEPDSTRAGVLSWLATIEEHVPTLSLLVTSAKYGDQAATLDDFLGDRLDAAVSLLRRDDPEAAALALGAASLAVEAGRALWNVANAPFLTYDQQHGRYEVPDGAQGQARAARDAIAEELYSELDAPFRKLLVDLGTPQYRLEARVGWAEVVTRTALRIARRSLERLSASEAFFGAMAEGWFLGNLSRARADFAPFSTNVEGT